MVYPISWPECRHAPIYLWYTLTRKGYKGMRKDVEKCMRNSHILQVIQATPDLFSPSALHCLTVFLLLCTHLAGNIGTSWI